MKFFFFLFSAFIFIQKYVILFFSKYKGLRNKKNLYKIIKTLIKRKKKIRNFVLENKISSLFFYLRLSFFLKFIINNEKIRKYRKIKYKKNLNINNNMLKTDFKLLEKFKIKSFKDFKGLNFSYLFLKDSIYTLYQNKNFKEICDSLNLFFYNNKFVNKQIDYYKLQRKILEKKKLDFYQELIISHKKIISIFLLYNKNIFSQRGKLCIIKKFSNQFFIDNFNNTVSVIKKKIKDLIFNIKEINFFEDNIFIKLQNKVLNIPEIQITNSFNFFNLYYSLLENTELRQQYKISEYTWLYPSTLFSLFSYINKIKVLNVNDRINIFHFLYNIRKMKNSFIFNFWDKFKKGFITFYETSYYYILKQILLFYNYYEFNIYKTNTLSLLKNFKIIAKKNNNAFYDMKTFFFFIYN